MTDPQGWGGVLPTEFSPEPGIPELLHLINALEGRVRDLEQHTPEDTFTH